MKQGEEFESASYLSLRRIGDEVDEADEGGEDNDIHSHWRSHIRDQKYTHKTFHTLHEKYTSR